jgi:hypothetical protein
MKTNLLFWGLLISISTIAQQESDFTIINITGGVKITDYTGSVTDVTIPSTIGGKDVISIGKSAFPIHFLTSLNLPSTIDTIGAHSCQWGKFDSLYIPEGVKYIDDNAFSAGELRKVIIPSSVNYIGESAFQQNHILSIDLPNNLTSIERFILKDNQLTSLTIPDNVTSIGEYAFYGNKIADITMPDYITYIGRTAFNSNKIETINNIQTNGIFFKRNSDSSIDSTVIVSYGGTAKIIDFIPNTVATIAVQAFYRDSLTKINIPSNVKVIENRAFAFNMLEEIVLSETLDSIGSQAFAYNDSLELVTVKHLDTITVSLNAFNSTKMDTNSSVILVYSEDVKTKYENSNWGTFGATIKAISSGAEFTVTDNESNPISNAEIIINAETFTTDERGVVFIKLFSGDYSFTVSAQNYLGADGTVKVNLESIANKAITLQNSASSINNQPKSWVKVYPNPVTDILTIESEQVNLIEILDIKGSVLLKTNIESKVQLDIGDYYNGVYLLRLKGINETSLYKIIKE